MYIWQNLSSWANSSPMRQWTILFDDKAIILPLNKWTKRVFIKSNKSLKPHSHCAGVATVHPDAGQPVYRDVPGHIS